MFRLTTHRPPSLVYSCILLGIVQDEGVEGSGNVRKVLHGSEVSYIICCRDAEQAHLEGGCAEGLLG